MTGERAYIMIDPIAAGSLESTPRIDIFGGMSAGQQQSNDSDKRRSGTASASGDILTLSPEARQQLAELRQREAAQPGIRPRAATHSDAGREAVHGTAGSAVTSSGVLLFQPAALKMHSEKVAAVYQAMQNSAQPSTDLAPWGTGIAYVV